MVFVHVHQQHRQKAQRLERRRSALVTGHQDQLEARLPLAIQRFADAQLAGHLVDDELVRFLHVRAVDLGMLKEALVLGYHQKTNYSHLTNFEHF